MRRIVGILIFSYAVLFSCCKKDEQPCLTCPSLPTDTTSHNFVWQVDTLGDGASSVLYDVAIINDTTVWAVGEIRKKDSLGNWMDSIYNLVKWNGREWKLERVPSVICGSNVNIISPVSTILCFDINNLWLSDGAEMIHWDGNNYIRDCSMNTMLSGAIKKLWGTSSNDLYVVGNNGLLAHYNGVNWQRIETGTTLSINDIWGGYNPVTRQWEILAVASNIGSSSERKILQIKGTTSSTLSDSPISWSLNGVWFVPCQHYYVIGSGIYEKENLSDKAWLNSPLDITTNSTTKIRGNSINDVVVVGAFGEILHYNGNNWHSYQSVTGLSNGVYISLAIKDNLVIAVGEDNARALIAIGRRII